MTISSSRMCKYHLTAALLVGFAMSATHAEEATQKRTRSIKIDGLWETDFGLLRIVTSGDSVFGAYTSQGDVVYFDASRDENDLRFDYVEPNGGSGEAWFQFQRAGNRFEGSYRTKGTKKWQTWNGARVNPKPNKTWLIVLEANWERRLADRQYAFGEMLEPYFKMPSARSVQFRHRFFHDRADLSRFCREIPFLSEPVVLVISTHGSPEGIQVFGDTIDSSELAQDLRVASNVRLLHLSGCDMMSGNFADEVRANAGGTRMSVSGYKTAVAWDASALADFTYLSLMLLRGLTPERAAEEAIRLSPYIGENAPKRSVFQPLGLSVLPRTR